MWPWFDSWPVQTLESGVFGFTTVKTDNTVLIYVILKIGGIAESWTRDCLFTSPETSVVNPELFFPDPTSNRVPDPDPTHVI